MSFQTGTAANFEDFFTRLYNFLTQTGHAWGKKFTGVGNGDLVNYAGKAASVAETITCTATTSTTFSVSGSSSGALGTATVGTPFTSAVIDFTLTAGGTAYQAGDVWTINTSPKWVGHRPFNGAWTADKSNLGTVNINPGGNPHVAQIKTIAAVEIREVSYSVLTQSFTPSAFTVDYSDDGSAWTTAASFSGLTSGTWPSSGERRFAVPASGAHRWWRVRMTAYNTSSNLSYSAIGFYDTVGSGVTYGGFPFFSVQAPGNDGALTAVHHVFEAQDTPGSDTYGLLIYPHTSAFNPILPANAQPGRDGQFAAVPLSNLPMNYWFVANGRRVAFAAKVSTVYTCGYAGLMLPYARPSAYPLPWFLGGCASAGTVRWSTTSETISFFARPTNNAGMAAARDISGTWRGLFNWQNNTNVPAGGKMYPNACSGTGGLSGTDGFPIACSDVRENFGGTYPLLPLIPGEPGRGSFGELDGVYWTTGFANAAENNIRFDRYDHVVISNIFRTQFCDYIALRLD